MNRQELLDEIGVLTGRLETEGNSDTRAALGVLYSLMAAITSGEDIQLLEYTAKYSADFIARQDQHPKLH